MFSSTKIYVLYIFANLRVWNPSFLNNWGWMIAGILFMFSYSSFADEISLSIQSWKSRDGADVYFVHRPQLPILDIEVIFDAGSSRDGTRKGLSNFTFSLMNKGAGGESAQSINRSFDRTGAEFSYFVGVDMAVMKLRSLVGSAYIEPSLQIFRNVIGSPDFLEHEFTKLKQRLMAELAQKEQDPSYLVRKEFLKALYGDHPYASPPFGLGEDIERIELADIVAFYRKYVVERNASVAIVGDIEVEQARDIAQNLLSALEAGDVASSLPPPVIPEESVVLHIPLDTQQSHVIIGGLGIAYRDPDAYVLNVGNYILGGSGFGSRLMEDLRVQKGYVYSVWSQFVQHRKRGSFRVVFQTQASQVTEAVLAADDILSQFVQEPLPKSKVEAAKTSIIQGFPLQIASNVQLIGWLRKIAFYRLDKDILNQYIARIDKVDREDILRAFAKVLQAQKRITVIVGPS